MHDSQFQVPYTTFALIDEVKEIVRLCN